MTETGRDPEENDAPAQPPAAARRSRWGSRRSVVSDNNKFQPGDHIYHWCSDFGVKKAYAHHGIVVCVADVPNQTTTTTEEENSQPVVEQRLTIVDVTNPSGGVGATRTRTHGSRMGSPSSSSRSSPSTTGKGDMLRKYTVVTSDHGFQWHKVHYDADYWRDGHMWDRSGTWTREKSDPTEKVLERVNFVWTNHNDDAKTPILPKYDFVHANCECFAIWCKTGKWITLQALSMLKAANKGSVPVFTALGTAMATAEVTVPASGVWGYLGYTTTASLAAACPVVVPLMGVAGATMVGSYYCKHHAHSKWKAITNELNEKFDEWNTRCQRSY